MRLTVVDEKPTGLNRQVWEFWIDGTLSTLNVWVESYEVQNRPTRRHDWRTASAYSRLTIRNIRPAYHPGQTLVANQVPTPEFVQQELNAQILALCTIKFWEDRK